MIKFDIQGIQDNRHFKGMALKDDGASHNFISESFVTKYNLKFKSTGHHIRVITADKDSKSASVQKERQVQCEISIPTKNGLFTFKETFDITNLGKYDILLGKAWHERFQPVINYRTNACRIGNADLIAKSTFNHLPEISAIQVEEALRNEEEVFICLVEDEKEYPAVLSPEIHDLLQEFTDVTNSKFDFPPKRPQDHHIQLINPTRQPINRPLPRLSIAESEILRKELSELTERNFIQPSSSPYGAVVLFVKKKTGELRMGLAYKALNKNTV